MGLFEEDVDGQAETWRGRVELEGWNASSWCDTVIDEADGDADAQPARQSPSTNDANLLHRLIFLICY